MTALEFLFGASIIALAIWILFSENKIKWLRYERDENKRWMEFWQEHVRANEKTLAKQDTLIAAQQERIQLQENIILFLTDVVETDIAELEIKVVRKRDIADAETN